MSQQKTASSVNEALEQSIRGLFEGVSFNNTVVKGIRIDGSPAGIVNVQMFSDQNQVIGSFQLPPSWHRHDFKIVEAGVNGTLRHCKICGQSSRLTHGAEKFRWVDIEESTE